jgi:hypothetical protein
MQRSMPQVTYTPRRKYLRRVWLKEDRLTSVRPGGMSNNRFDDAIADALRSDLRSAMRRMPWQLRRRALT